MLSLPKASRRRLAGSGRLVRYTHDIYWPSLDCPMPPTIRNGRHPTTIRPALGVAADLLSRRLRALKRHLRAAVAGDAVGTHRARVASRRLREAVPVLAAPSKARRRARESIRRVTRALGTVREMDVTMKVLDELSAWPQLPPTALEDLRAHVIAERERRRAIMLERFSRVNVQKLTKRLDALAGQLSRTSDHPWRDVLITRIRRRATRLARAVDNAGQMYAPDRLHEVRIAAKKLRYALELAADARVAAARTLVATLKRTQETLGRLHDLQIIQHHVAAVQARPPERRGAADGGLDVITSVLEGECRHLHARYSRQVPALLDLAAACRSGAGARGPAAPRRPTPLKMLRPRMLRADAARRA